MQTQSKLEKAYRALADAVRAANRPSHRILLSLEADGAGPFLCSCNAVLWSAEEGLDHLTAAELELDKGDAGNGR
jgi:hypothetical protein